MLVALIALATFQAGSLPPFDLPVDARERAATCIAILDAEYAAVDGGRSGPHDLPALDAAILWWMTARNDSWDSYDDDVDRADAIEMQRPVSLQAERVAWCAEPQPPFDTVQANRPS